MQPVNRLSSEPLSHRQEHVLADVPSDSGPRKISMWSWPLAAIQRVLFSREWVAELLCEFRNYLHRSSTLLRLRTVALADLGPHVGRDSNGRLIPCSRTHGRMQDLQKFHECRPWIAREDMEIFLIGWNAGAAWSESNPHNCTPSKGKSFAPCMRPYDPKRRWKDPTL